MILGVGMRRMCVKELEKQVEQCKALADENNTLRLQLGKDAR